MPPLPGKDGWAPYPVVRHGIVGPGVSLFPCAHVSAHTHTGENQWSGERHHAVSSGQLLLISVLILWDRFCYCLCLATEEMESPMLNIWNTAASPGSKRQTHYSIFSSLSNLLLSLQPGPHCLEISFPWTWLKLHSWVEVSTSQDAASALYVTSWK